MKDKERKSISTPDEKSKITLRRLLLSKQVYLHGLEHSTKQGVINGILAITNFHNAIETTLRAIILHHEIRTEKRLNITFEAMLNEIDKYFRNIPKRKPLPYRHELRDLNNRRNLALHEAVEPPPETIDEWKVFTNRFLTMTFTEYFGLDFDNVSMVDLIEDALLNRLFELSNRRMRIKDYTGSVTLAKMAYQYAAQCVPVSEGGSFFNHNSFSPSREHPEIKELIEIVKQINNDVSELKKHIALLTTGINFADYKKLNKLTPVIHFTAGGTSSIYYKKINSLSDAQWVYNFVLDAIIIWQSLGLQPIVPDWGTVYCKAFLEKNAKSEKKELVFDVKELHAKETD